MVTAVSSNVLWGRTGGAEPAIAAELDDVGGRLETLKTRTPIVREILSEAVPGISVAAIVNGRVVWSAGFGTRKAGEDQPVDADTVFEAASLSKPLLAYAVIQLCERGLFDLDRPLLDYLPDHELSADPKAQKVTARLVLSHCTGLPNWRKGDELAFEFNPGEKYGYSGEAYFWLQRVIEHVTKTPFARLMREQVLEPCGMTRSSFVLRRDMLANYASAHASRGNSGDGIYVNSGRRQLELARKWKLPTEDWFYADAVRAVQEVEGRSIAPQNLSPNTASSLLTTAGDYARFMTRFMPNGENALPDATRQAMLRSCTEINRAVSWSLGWALELTSEAKSFWHSGHNRGFKNVALGDVSGRLGVVLLTNSNEGDRLRWPIVYDFTGRGGIAML